MNNHEAAQLITVPEHLKAKPATEVTAIHTSDDIEVSHNAEYTSSGMWHYPAAIALGGVAVNSQEKGEFRGDPSKVPGTEAYKLRQAEISNLAHSELAVSNAHTRRN